MIVAGERFANEFYIESCDGHEITDDAKQFCDAMKRIVSGIPDLKPNENALSDAITSERNNFLSQLKSIAEDVLNDKIDLKSAFATAYSFQGHFEERIDRLRDALFVVREKVDAEAKAIDIRIDVGNKKIPNDKQNLKVQIDDALTVIKVVFTSRAQQTRGSAEARSKLDEYVRKLAGIARVGLEDDDHAQFAGLALDGLKAEFVAREAGPVKNTYLKRLGVAALLACGIALILYVGCRQLEPQSTFFRYKEFFLLAAGTSIGTWLSFSIRRVSLSFADLALLEEDRVNPGMRITFMIALTTIVGLLFSTHAVDISIGGFTTKFAAAGATAFLIGSLCGIAERTLATAVSQRAGEFVRSIGGKSQSNPQ